MVRSTSPAALPAAEAEGGGASLDGLTRKSGGALPSVGSASGDGGGAAIGVGLLRSLACVGECGGASRKGGRAWERPRRSEECQKGGQKGCRKSVRKGVGRVSEGCRLEEGRRPLARPPAEGSAGQRASARGARDGLAADRVGQVREEGAEGRALRVDSPPGVGSK